MSLRNDSLADKQTVSSKDSLEIYKQFVTYSKLLDNTEKMIDNIDDAKRKLNELKEYNYNDFQSSFNLNVFERNIDTMTSIASSHTRGLNEIVTVYEAATMCNDIYKRYRGDSNVRWDYFCKFSEVIFR